MAEYTSHIYYSEYGADLEGAVPVHDPVTGITAFVAIKLQVPLDNKSDVIVLLHRPGGPPPVTGHYDHIVHNIEKGESVGACQEGTGLRILVNGHRTTADPTPHPPGTRETVLETFLIPNVFV